MLRFFFYYKVFSLIAIITIRPYRRRERRQRVVERDGYDPVALGGGGDGIADKLREGRLDGIENRGDEMMFRKENRRIHKTNTHTHIYIYIFPSALAALHT